MSFNRGRKAGSRRGHSNERRGVFPLLYMSKYSPSTSEMMPACIDKWQHQHRPAPDGRRFTDKLANQFIIRLKKKNKKNK